MLLGNNLAGGQDEIYPVVSKGFCQSSFPAKSYTGASSITFGRETNFVNSESP